MRDYAVLCPGQGAQRPDMFDLAQGDPRGLDVLRRFARVVGHDLVEKAQSAVGLDANAWAQPALVASARASWEILRADLPPPALYAGYSVGEVSAWSCAGTWDVETSARVSVARARMMDDDSPSDCGMLAVRGLPLRVVAAQAEAASLHVAIVNASDHVVLAGPSAALDDAAEAWRRQGAWLRRLGVRVPSHTVLLAAAASRFEQWLQQQPGERPAVPVLSGLDGRSREPRQGLSALAESVAKTVQWAACMDTLAERGIRVALELGPGDSLSKLLADARPDIEVRSVSDFRSWAGAIRWLRSRLDARP